MRAYELVLVLKSMSESERKKILDSVKGWLKEIKLVKEDEWGEKALSYKIKGEKIGYYVDYQLEAEEAMPLGFEKRLSANESILRHLIVRRK